MKYSDGSSRAGELPCRRRIHIATHLFVVLLVAVAGFAAQTPDSQQSNKKNEVLLWLKKAEEADKKGAGTKEKRRSGSKSKGSVPTDDSEWSKFEAAGEKALLDKNDEEAGEQLSSAVLEAKRFGAQDRRLATSLYHLGNLYYGKKDYADAELAFSRAISIWENLEVKEDYPSELSQALQTLVLVYREEGKSEEADGLRGAISIYYEIAGTVSHGQYTSPNHSFHVKVPHLMTPGATVRDRRIGARRTEFECWDDFGTVYTISETGGEAASITDAKLEALIAGDNNVRERHWIETARGRELRFVSLIPQGSPIVSHIFSPGKEPVHKRADLVSSTSIFRSSGRVYEVAAGRSLLEQGEGKVEEETKLQLKSDLDEFLSGFAVLPSVPPE